MSTVLDGAVIALGAAGSAAAGLRWLRVAQREHYLAGSTTRFAARWWRIRWQSAVLLAIAVVAFAVSFWTPLAAVIAVLAVTIGPLGLGVRGRTSPLAWTRRLKTLAGLSGVLWLLIVVIGVLVGVTGPAVAFAALAVPLLIDAALAILAPLEERAARHFVEQASFKLAAIAPTVVGITGSYGKTSTKNHLATLIGTDRAVVPSPRSFNNRAGLARAINEHLAPGTDVFIAEMGTYGPGEIADMCRWCPPKVAVITAIGPVHLERFGSLEVTTTSKAEIAVSAEVVVLNVDDQHLGPLADQMEASGRRVIRASAQDAHADVAVVPDASSWGISVGGTILGASPVLTGVQPSNVACALGAAIALGLDPATVAARVALLTNIENRLAVVTAPSGVVVVDDTFNSNPAGASAALEVLRRLDVSGRRVLVTPGMIELGTQQAADNETFAAEADGCCDVIVVVGRTNRKALLAGAHRGRSASIVLVDHREAAVAWVRSSLGAGDAVLYENDLPDNYP